MYNLLNLPVPVEHTDWGADCIVLVCLCRALDCSKFHYRCIVYGSAHWSVLNQGLHIALGAFRTSPAQSLYVEAHKLSLTFRRLKLSLNYVLKLNLCREIQLIVVFSNQKTSNYMESRSRKYQLSTSAFYPTWRN